MTTDVISDHVCFILDVIPNLHGANPQLQYNFHSIHDSDRTHYGLQLVKVVLSDSMLSPTKAKHLAIVVVLLFAVVAEVVGLVEVFPRGVLALGTAVYMPYWSPRGLGDVFLVISNSTPCRHRHRNLGRYNTVLR
jgi:hypothetical protein